MKHLPLILCLATPAGAATVDMSTGPITPNDITFEWTMTPGATQHVWGTETGTFTIRPSGDWFVIDYARDQYVPGYRAAAWWHAIDANGMEIDRGDIVDMGGCPVHGGLARREDRAQPWLTCGTGTVVVTPPEAVPLPASGFYLAGALAFALAGMSTRRRRV